MNTNFIKPLTGVRALAAFAVFFFHFPISGLPTIAQGFLAQGYIGVTLFYVLSGFLITYHYYPQPNTRVNWRQYFQHRLARIYPVYLLILLATFIFLRWQHLSNLDLNLFTHPSVWWFMQLTLLKGYFNNYIFTGIPQSWSLTVECTFYIFVPLLFVLFRHQIRWLNILIIYAIGTVLYFIGIALHWPHFIGNGTIFWLYTFFGRCFEIIIGMILAIYLNHPHKNPWFKRIPGKTYLGFIGMLIIAWLLHWYQGNNIPGPFSPIGMLLANWLLPFLVALFIGGLIIENSLLGKLLSTTLFQLLGRTSYAFYLLQFLVMAFVIHDTPFRLSHPHSLFIILSGFILTNIIAMIVYHYYEQPMHRFLTRQKKKVGWIKSAYPPS